MMKKNSILLIGLLVALASTTQAQVWTQIGQNINGEAAGNFLGTSTSISSNGSIVAIGAPANSQNGFNAGHVRIYQNQGGAWTQLGQDIDGEAAYDEFGSAVSISSDGSIVAIGAFGNDGNGSYAGHVRVYEYKDAIWTQIGQDIDGETAGDQSGTAVSLNSDGTIVAIGAPSNSENNAFSGNVRVYQYNGAAWIQIGQDIDGEAATDFSGIAVSLSSDGSIVAIGADANDGNGSNAGQVRIYQNQNGEWTKIGQDIDGEAAEDYSGRAVSLSSDGSIVAIGADANDGNGSNAGQVRIYQNQGGTWTQLGQDIDGEAAVDGFGSSVSISSDGSIVAISAPENDGNGSWAGHVRVYENKGGVWLQTGQDIDGFGSSVSISSDGSIVAIGASGNDGNGSLSGHLKIYASTSVGVETQQQPKFLIYPNPTSNSINLKLVTNDIKKITISDIVGRQLYEKIKLQQNEQIDLSGFTPGIYLIQFQTNNQTFEAKILKE
jgi:uncharacterized protein (DUF736 family)